MTKSTLQKKATVDALRVLLRPICRLIIALGFSTKDFCEVAKSVYVDVATNEFGPKGRRANISRVAMLTGLTRREVSRLRKVAGADPIVLDDPMAPLGLVLEDWHQEPKFLGHTGLPKPLSYRGEFSDLVNQYRGDVPLVTFVKELEDSGAIKIENNMVSVLSRYYMPFELKPQAIERFGRVIGDVSDTICRNLLQTDRLQSVFEGRASSVQVAASSHDAFQNYLERRGMEMLEDVDGWLNDHASQNPEESIRLGLGIYSIGDIR